MKLGPFRIGRDRVTAAAATPKAPPRELGATGTLNIGGLLQSSEYNPDLTGLNGIRMFDRMLKSDGSVQEAFEHIAAPIRNSSVEIDPASDDPQDLEIAGFLHKAFFEWPNQPFLEFLDALLDYLRFGHAVFEPVFQVVEDTVCYDNPDTGDEVETAARQFLAWSKFAQRLPETLYKWNTDGSGTLLSVTQRTYRGGDFVEVDIPADRLLVLTNKKRGDEFTGQSILRAAVKPFIYKELIEKIEAIGLERLGPGIPVVYPSEASKTDDALLDKWEDIMRQLRAGEFSYIVAPEPKRMGAQDGAIVEFLTPSSPPNYEAAKNYHRAEIKAAVLARFSELGHQTTGARATGDIQSVVWFAAITAVARYLENVLQAPIRQLVDANYAGVSEYPKLRFSGMDERNLAEWAMANAQLVSAGAITVDQSYRKYVRSQLDAPEEDDPQAEPDGGNGLNNTPKPDMSPDQSTPRDGNAPPSQQIEEE